MDSRKNVFFAAFSFAALMIMILFIQACSNSPSSPAPTPTPAPANTNTAVPSNTPTNTATPTVTNTCTVTTTPGLIDDMENPTPTNNQVIVQACRGGYWFASNDAGKGGLQTTGGVGLPLPPAATQTAQPTPTTEPWTKVAGGTGAGCSGSSNFAVEVSTNDGYSSYQNFGFNFTNPKAPINGFPYTGIQFCGKNTSGTLVVSFMVSDNDPNVQNYSVGPHAAPVTLTSSWANYQFPFTTFSGPTSLSCTSYPRGIGCNTYGTPTVFETNALMSLGWQPPNSTFTDVFLDNVSFY